MLLYLDICFLITLRNLWKQVFEVLLLLVAVACVNNYTSTPLLIYGGDGGCIELAILWPVSTARVPHLPLWHNINSLRSKHNHTVLSVSWSEVNQTKNEKILSKITEICCETQKLNCLMCYDALLRLWCWFKCCQWDHYKLSPSHQYFLVPVTDLFIRLCIVSFPALVLFVVFAFFSWLVFLGGLWLIFTFKGSLANKATAETYI